MLIAPLMPGINDEREQVERIVEGATEANATYIGGQTLFLRGSTRDVFFEWLREHRPELLERYERLYAKGAYLSPAERRKIEVGADAPWIRRDYPADEFRAAARVPAPRGRPGVAAAAAQDRDPGDVVLMRTARRACDGGHGSETRGDGQCWLWSATPIPTTRRADGAIPDAPDRQARPPSEVGAGGADPAVRLTIVAYVERERIFGVDTPVRVAAAVVMVILGWALARDLGRFTAPALFRRMDPATAGTAGFLIRLVFIVVAAIVSLRVAGLNPATLALGGAITAVVLGLAAQQTLGNVFAGIVLIAVRPFKVGDRVRLQAAHSPARSRASCPRSACSTRPSRRAATR